MNRLILLLTLLLLPAFAACSSAGVQNGPLSGSASYAGDDDIKGVIQMDNERIHFGRSDFAIYQVDLINEDEEDVQVEYRAVWSDADGIEVNSVTRSWKKVFVPGRTHTPVTSIAPNMEAVTCHISVRLSEN